jgi:hypothetical protein
VGILILCLVIVNIFRISYHGHVPVPRKVHDEQLQVAGAWPLDEQQHLGPQLQVPGAGPLEEQQQLGPQLQVPGAGPLEEQQQLGPQLQVPGDVQQQLPLLQQLQNVVLLQQLMQLMQQQQLQQQMQGGHLFQHHQLQLQQHGGQLQDHIVVVGPISEPSIDQEEEGNLTNFESKLVISFFSFTSHICHSFWNRIRPKSYFKIICCDFFYHIFAEKAIPIILLLISDPTNF